MLLRIKVIARGDFMERVARSPGLTLRSVADAHCPRGPRAAAPGAHAGGARLHPDFCGGELVPVFDELEHVNRALGARVCADGIVPCPPGILVLVPGQLVTPRVTDYLAGLLRSPERLGLHGIVHKGCSPCLRVRKPSEERALWRLR
jgi:hypothetical protein